MKTLVSLTLIVALMAGCTNREDQIPFDGFFFRTKVKKVDGERHVFTVAVRDVDQSLDGAREAARHGGNAYCVETFGSSDIEWVVGPDTPEEEFVITDNTLTFQGVCPKR